MWGRWGFSNSCPIRTTGFKPHGPDPHLCEEQPPATATLHGHATRRGAVRRVHAPLSRNAVAFHGREARGANLAVGVGAPFPPTPTVPPSTPQASSFPLPDFTIANCACHTANMANTTLGKRTRSSKETGDAEPARGLDFSAKRARRTPSKNSQHSQKEHMALYDGEDQENEHVAPDSPAEGEAEAESTPYKAQSRRTSIATTVRSGTSTCNQPFHPVAHDLLTPLSQSESRPSLPRLHATTMSSPAAPPRGATASCRLAGSRSG